MNATYLCRTQVYCRPRLQLHVTLQHDVFSECQNQCFIILIILKIIK